jgi:hypothetical protein
MRNGQQCYFFVFCLYLINDEGKVSRNYFFLTKDNAEMKKIFKKKKEYLFNEREKLKFLVDDNTE